MTIPTDTARACASTLRSIAAELDRERERLRLFGYHGVSRLDVLAERVRNEAKNVEAEGG